VPYLALVALPSLKDVNDNQGYAAGDQYVEKASSLLQAQIRNLQHAQLFRLSGSEFAILATLGTTSSQEFAMHVRQAFEIANTEQYPHGFASIALLPVAPHDDLSASLSRLDGLQAKQQAEPSPALALPVNHAPTGRKFCIISPARWFPIPLPVSVTLNCIFPRTWSGCLKWKYSRYISSNSCCMSKPLSSFARTVNNWRHRMYLRWPTGLVCHCCWIKRWSLTF
jgi:hypothetical protein